MVRPAPDDSSSKVIMGYSIDRFSICSIQYFIISSGRTGYVDPVTGNYAFLRRGLCDRMDKIIKITLGLFIVILVAFTATAAYNVYVEISYRNSLASTYSYALTLTTDSRLDNVTLFIPVPDDRAGNSPIVVQYSSHEIPQIPGDWKTELFGTGKATLVKIGTPSIIPPDGTSAAHPFTISVSTQVPSGTIIDTENPIYNSAIFRPVQDLRNTSCTVIMGTVQGSPGPECFTYDTAVYADYQTDPNATVIIRSALTGTNNWKIFGPESNEFQTNISVMMHGQQHGWAVAQGYLEEGMGVYDNPVLPP
jgi:hypothetical protein